MDFKLVAKTQAQKVVREGTYTEDLMDTVKELWEVTQEHGETHVIQLPSFGSAEEAKKWLSKAQAYGKTQGLYVHQGRGYVPEEEFGLVVWLESVADREARIEERKVKAAEVEARRAAGEEIKKGPKGGRKKAAEVQAA